MQTKRKQTLLAGAGLLTALTLTMTACTPSKFTPGPGVPTQANPGQNTPGVSNEVVNAINGLAEIDGKPLANADVRLVNIATGNVIATGGGNTKTDALGNFSVAVAGLTVNDVVRVEVAAEGLTMAALMTGDGLTTQDDAPAGYAVADLSTTLRIDPTTTFQAHALSKVLKLLAKDDLRESRRALMNKTKENHRALKQAYREDRETFRQVARQSFTNPDAAASALFNQVAVKAGIVASLTTAITAAVEAAAKANADAVKTLGTDSVSPVVSIKIEIVGNTIKIGDTIINTETGVVTTPSTSPSSKPSEAPPSAPPSEAPKTETDKTKGTWVKTGMSPTVTINSSSVTVSQVSGDAQMQSMTLVIPKANLTNGSLANLSGSELSGSVTGTTRPTATNTAGSPRSGALTFTVTTSNDKMVSGAIELGTFGTIGSYTVSDEGGAFKLVLNYTFDDMGIELVGSHTTIVSADTAVLNKNDGMSIDIGGANGSSARVQF